MIIQICISAIAISFVALVIFLIVKMQAMEKDLKKAKHELNALSHSGLELIENLNGLAEDLRKKSEALNFIFRFMGDVNKKTSTKLAHRESAMHGKSEKIAEIIDIIGTGVSLYKRIKGDVKKYVKSK